MNLLCVIPSQPSSDRCSGLLRAIFRWRVPLAVIALVSLLSSQLFARLPPRSTGHAISSATVKGVNRTYTYDAAGYVTNDGKRAYTWTSFGQLASLTYQSAPELQNFAGTTIFAAANVGCDFAFDAGGNRARQTKERTATNDSRILEETLYLGSYEREIHSTRANGTANTVLTKTVHRHSIGGFASYTRTVTGTGTAIKLTTILKDHLGSTSILYTGTWNGNAFTGQSTERQSFDPWGERRASDTFVSYRSADTDAFRTSARDYDRGYTGHEQLDDSGLIHMNGRIYDPELGRMLSPDPVVQMPTYSQNFNRYSYVLNNPLNMTDPTGFSWLSNAFHKVGHWLGENWRTVAAIVVAVIAWYAAPAILGAFGAGASITGAGGATIAAAGYAAQGAVAGAIAGGFNSAINGGDLGDVLRGAAVGAIQGAIAGGVLHGLGEAARASGNPGLFAAHIAGHGIVGGAANEALGGKFQDGFLSAAASAAAVGAGLYEHGNIVSNTVRSAVIGGTASTLGGGKFANGAFTGSFQFVISNLHSVASGLSGLRADNFMNTAANVMKSVAAGFNILGDASEAMRIDQVAQSRVDNRNSRGISAGYKGDGFKLGGSRHNPENVKYESPLGGLQGGPGKIFGYSYDPGDVFDTVVEVYAGPHDFVSKWSYDANGNIPAGRNPFTAGFTKAMSFVNLLTATPFAASSVLLPTSRDIEGGWPGNASFQLPQNRN